MCSCLVYCIFCWLTLSCNTRVHSSFRSLSFWHSLPLSHSPTHDVVRCSLRFALTLRLCACPLLAAVSCCCGLLLHFFFSSSFAAFNDVDVGNLAAANKMFICYLLKTILNKIQTMYSHSLTHSTSLWTYTLFCLHSHSLVSLSLAYSASFQGIAIGMLLCASYYCCCFCHCLLLLWVAGWLLFCCVVSLEYDAACLCVYWYWCVCVPFSHWLSLTNRVVPDDCYS